jgi:hypothetical protein
VPKTYIVSGPCPVSGHNPGEVVTDPAVDIQFLLAHGFIHEAAEPSQSEAPADDVQSKEKQ